jgi:hypothetical protein
VLKRISEEASWSTLKKTLVEGEISTVKFGAAKQNSNQHWLAGVPLFFLKKHVVRACLGSFTGSFTQLQIKKIAPLQIFSAKHTQLQQLHRGSAKTKVEQTPNSMVFMECLKRYSTKSKFPGVRRNYPPLPLV